MAIPAHYFGPIDFSYKPMRMPIIAFRLDMAKNNMKFKEI